MSESEHKFKWCLEKAKKELEKGEKHRGLIEIKPDKEKAKQHIIKAEHYLEASIYLKEGNFSDISASTLFYSAYHCMLAIAAKFGYESRNQDCTFALINALIEDKKINLEGELIDKVAIISQFQGEEKTALEIREQYQYGTELSLKESLYEDMLNLIKIILEKSKEIIED